MGPPELKKYTMGEQYSPNMRLYCLSMPKIIAFKIFDGASFWVKNAIKK